MNSIPSEPHLEHEVDREDREQDRDGEDEEDEGHQHRHLLLARQLQQPALGVFAGILSLGPQHLGKRRAALERDRELVDAAGEGRQLQFVGAPPQRLREGRARRDIGEHRREFARQFPAADARDAAQSGFLKAWLGLRHVDPSRPFQPWLLTIVANEARNRRRARRRWLARVLPEDRIDLLTDPEVTPEQRVEQQDETANVLRHMVAMDETDRVTLWCRHVLGLSERETAEVMGCAVGTVKSRAHRAMERLREQLHQAGVPAGTGGGEHHE